MNCTIANRIIPPLATKITLVLPRSFIIDQK